MNYQGQEFTHKGLFLNIIPVYLCADDPEGLISVRHWSLEIPMDIVEGAFGMLCALISMVNPDFEPSFQILITGEV